MKLSEWFGFRVALWDSKFEVVESDNRPDTWDQAYHKGQLRFMMDLDKQFGLSDKLPDDLRNKWLDIQWEWTREGREPGGEEDDRVPIETNGSPDYPCSQCGDLLVWGWNYPADDTNNLYCSYHCRKEALNGPD